MKKLAFIGVLIASMSLAAPIANAQEEHHAPGTPDKRYSPEFGVIYDHTHSYSSIALSGGIRTQRFNVFGLELGYAQKMMDSQKADFAGRLHRITKNYILADLHYRRYIPNRRRNRMAFYPDITIGGRYIYNVEGKKHNVDDDLNYGKGTVELDVKARFGIEIRLWRESRLSVGMTTWPSFGFHAGLTI
jgi:hypothetical protein